MALALVTEFPVLPSQTHAKGPDTLDERLGQIQQHDTPLFETDGGRAEVFAAVMEDWAYLQPDTGDWAIWDEFQKRWTVTRELGISRLADQFLRRMIDVAEGRRVFGLRNGNDGLLSNKTLRSLCQRVRQEPSLHRPSTEFDRNPYLLGVQNGVVDLRDGRVYQSCRGAYVTIYTETPYYGKRVHSEHWDQLLLDITGSDRQLREFLRSWFGSMLTGANPRERFTLLHGPGGTGKGTLVSAIMGALGPHAMTITTDTLSKQSAGSVREDLASMQGKRLVVCPELSTDAIIDPTLIKTLTGQDAIRARKLYQGGQTIQPTWSLVVCCNRWPRLASEHDSGWWRRILAIPFDRRPEFPDGLLKQRLSEPEERASILSWLIAGSVAWYRTYDRAQVWRLPRAVDKAIADYKLGDDHLGFWLDSCVSAGTSSDDASNQDILESYLGFCAHHDIEEHLHATQTRLSKLLRDNGFKRKRLKRNGEACRGFGNIVLKTTYESSDTSAEQPTRVLGSDFEA